jgi:predicted MFS family arabinose efflux permease
MEHTAADAAAPDRADLPSARAWSVRIAVQLAVLSAAAFIYVTAEMVPVAALPAIAADLHVSAALVGTLLASYALVAAVTTVPLVRVTAHWPRRRTLLLTLMCLTASQLMSALAPNFAVLAAGRVLCAVTHGLMWSVIAPIGARLVPSTHIGRATTAVYLGTTLALVVGNPLTAAMSQLWGWRLAVVVVTAAAAAITAAAWLSLPKMPARTSPSTPEHIGLAHPHERHYRNGRLVTLSVLTLVGVAGHFVSYTFIVLIIQKVVGVHGPQLAWLLAAYGIAGLTSMGVLARPLDRHPWAAVIGCLSALAVGFAALTLLAVTRQPAGLAMLAGSAAIVLWGAAVTALPPMLQSTAMRGAPTDPDGASGLYVTAFQVGIMAGSLLGGLLYARGGVPAIVAASGLLVVTALAGVLSNRGLFRLPPVAAVVTK